jgi:cholest-4-en-3-one 26-monooxygenase
MICASFTAIWEGVMAAVGSDLDDVLVGEREHWKDGPPHELFARMRGECPVHWTDRVTEYSTEGGSGR